MGSKESSRMSRNRRFSWKQLLLLVVVWRVWIFVLQFVGLRLAGHDWPVSYIAFDTLGLWDGYWHRQIAEFGYNTAGLTLRFPLYPVLIKIFKPLFLGNSLLSALFISLLALYLAIFFLQKLILEEFGDRKMVVKTLVLVLFFPTSFIAAALADLSLG